MTSPVTAGVWPAALGLTTARGHDGRGDHVAPATRRRARRCRCRPAHRRRTHCRGGRSAGPTASGDRCPPAPVTERTGTGSAAHRHVEPQLVARPAPRSTGSSHERDPTCCACRRPRLTTILGGGDSRCSTPHGYDVVHVGSGAYNGVAIAVRHRSTTSSAPAGSVTPRSIANHGLITALVATPSRCGWSRSTCPTVATLDHWHFAYKLAFLDALPSRVAHWLDDAHVVVAGDINVAADRQ